MSAQSYPLARSGRQVERISVAKASKASRIRSLLRHAPDSLVIAKLSCCSSASPCHSEACPVCTRRFRMEILRSARDLSFGSHEWVRVSVIPQNMRFAAGELSNLRLIATLKAIRRRTQRAGLGNRLLIGGLDLSWNTVENSDGHWQAHYYALISGIADANLANSVKLIFKPCSEVLRPIHTQRVQQPLPGACLTYLYKAEFYARSSYPETRLRVDGTPRQNVRPNRLPADRRTELIEWLGTNEIGSRLLLHGLRRNRSWSGQLSLWPSPSSVA